MITPSFGLTATERVLPKLALDFTTASLDSRITFTRTTGASNPATYVDSNGYVTAATNDQPRFDYDPVTLVCKGLLIEEARANIFTYSEQFDNAAWTKSGSSISANAVNAPSNTLTADKLVEDTSTGAHLIRQSWPLTVTPHTFSIFVKAAGRNKFQIKLFNASTFNFDLGTLTPPANATITPAANGFYKITATGTPPDTVSRSNTIQLMDDSGNLTYTGDGVSGIYIWGAQLEAGAFATSYIPTTTTALTRNADVATMTGTNFSDWYNASEGTFAVKFSTPSTSSNGFEARATSGNTDFIRIARSNTTGYVRIFSGGAEQAGMLPVYGGSWAVGVTVVGAYKVNNFSSAVNGNNVSTDAAGAVPVSVTNANLGTSAGGGYINGHLQEIRYWPQRITNSEVQAFSKG